MDKSEILKSLSDMFAEKQDDDSDYVIESKTIEKNNYLTLIAKEKEDSYITDPDFEAFVNLLKYYNTKELNYAASKMQNNKVKILKELPDEERAKVLKEMRELHNKLLGSRPQTMSLVESLIKDFIDTI
ncbi:MAG TPA: hypothetical protein VN131_03655 [Mobilitalea sp.]|nr:hypothetical protein [Mobilitalea sp.]